MPTSPPTETEGTATPAPTGSPEPTGTPQATVTPTPEVGREPVADAEVVLSEIEAGSQSNLLGAPPESDYQAFVNYVFTNVDQFWSRALPAAGLSYFTPTLRIVESEVSTDCGPYAPAEGPVYCSKDRTVVMPLPYLSAFTFDEPGDFSLAYVVAHEMGHHVQALSGLATAYTAARVEVAKQLGGDAEAAALAQLAIGNELQADCLAGVWAHSAYQANLLDATDLPEAIALAWALGASADRPLEGAHGTKEQRSQWFQYGYDTGLGSECKTHGGNVVAQSPEETRALVRVSQFFRAINLEECDVWAPVTGSDILAGWACPPRVRASGLVDSITAWFFQFKTGQGLSTELERVEANAGAVSERWWYGTDQANPQGTVVRWTDPSGQAWLVWTHDAVLMMGQARENYGDRRALFDWWSEIGSSTRAYNP